MPGYPYASPTACGRICLLIVRHDLLIHCSMVFMTDYFASGGGMSVLQFWPSRLVVIFLVFALLITKLSEKTYCCNQGSVYRFVHIGIGGLLFIAHLGLVITAVRF